MQIFKIRKSLILLLLSILIIAVSCSDKKGKYSDKIIGVKTYKLRDNYDSLVDKWKETGINTAFVSKELTADKKFRKLAKEKKIKIFTILPVFFAPEELHKDSSLYAITNKGNKAIETWVEFACPSNPEFRKNKINEIVSFVKKEKPDGISIDFIRHFLFWEMVKPDQKPQDIEHGCFCNRCIESFAKEYDIIIPDTCKNVIEISKWILNNKKEEWAERKGKLISSMLSEIVTKVKKELPDVLVNFHAVPWRENDYSQARKYFAAQDIEKIAEIVDYISPMCYTFMLYRDSEWVGSVVEDFNKKASNKVLPSIQVKESYRSEKYKTEDFKNDLEKALAGSSQGVIFWSWEHLEKVPENIEVIKAIVLSSQ